MAKSLCSGLYAPDFDLTKEFADYDNYGEYKHSTQNIFGPMLKSANIKVPFFFTEQELRTSSDVKILKRSFQKLKDKSIGANGILLRPSGQRWVIDYIYEEEEDYLDTLGSK